MTARVGKALDIACGTGAVMRRLAKMPQLEVHGCDISDALLDKAIQNGLPRERLTVCDATKMPYGDMEFDFSYSIGSLEHFTLDGLSKTASEAARVTKMASFHMVPTSRSGRDEGWLKTYQSMHNCSVDWWLEKFSIAFREVHVMESGWSDHISVGKWFACLK
jgi:ubiquinone/menaquinone biosynthesis C-methylase UbiE